MTTHAPHVDEPRRPRRPAATRIRPYYLVIGIGIAFAVFTAAVRPRPAARPSGTRSRIGRPEVFGGIPGALKLAFYTVIAGAASSTARTSSPSG